MHALLAMHASVLLIRWHASGCWRQACTSAAASHGKSCCMHAPRLGDAARLRSHLFPDVPAGRKGLIGGMIVMAIALVAMVLLISGRAKKQRAPRKSATPAAA